MRQGGVRRVHMSPQEALGAERMARFDELRTWLVAERALSDEAETTTVTLMSMSKAEAVRWRQAAATRREDWVFANQTDGRVWALDEPSDIAFDDPAGAVFYPE